MKAVFKEVSPKGHQERMTRSGLPDHFAVAVTELSEALMLKKRP
jgi:hypothetical protein